MFSKKGQGTTEYLIILAVIIVIALVVVGVMGWLPGLSTGITEQQSRAYFKSTAPLAIVDYQINATTDANFTIQNMTTDKITVTEIKLNGTAVGVTDDSIAAGSTENFGGTTVPTCSSGDTYQYTVTITYDVDGGLEGKVMKPNKPLVGKC